MGCRVPNSKLYLEGNSWDGKPVGWDKVGYSKAPSELRTPQESDVRVDRPLFQSSACRSMSGQEAYEYVLGQAGHSLKRDDVDKRLVNEVRQRKGSLVPSSANIPHCIGPAPSEPWADSNSNGIPDWWHLKHGFDPIDWLEPFGDLDGDGYTNIEEYLNSTDPTKFVNYDDLTNNVNSLDTKPNDIK